MTRGYEAIRCARPEDVDRVVVEWLLATICNYRCSYCPDELHDGMRGWLPWSTVDSFTRRAATHYRDREISFLLTGGEPTLYPDLLRLADLIHDLGGAVAVLSNGSRRLSWWERAIERFDEVLLSYHCEFAERARFLDLAAYLDEGVALQVNVVMVPDRFDECLDAARAIECVAPRAVVHQKPLMDRWRHVHGYDDHHREHLLKVNTPAAGEERYPTGTALKGDLLAVLSDGSAVPVTPMELILRCENRWSGWECSVGLDTLFIRGDEAYRGVCAVGGRLGSIDDPSMLLPTVPVVCTADACNCIAGIKSTKHAGSTGSSL